MDWRDCFVMVGVGVILFRGLQLRVITVGTVYPIDTAVITVGSMVEAGLETMMGDCLARGNHLAGEKNHPPQEQSPNNNRLPLPCGSFHGAIRLVHT